jgi:FAD/FMN-containing dehydrogenase
MDVSSLRRGFEGRICLPGQDGYDTARTVWNAMVDRRPAVVAQPANPADVARAIRFGRELGLAIGIRSGGHGVTGHAVPSDGLMIDLSGLSAVRVDPERRRAWVQGGALLGNLDRAAQAFGLATTAGNVSHTGVGGLTLGGGMGWLARQHGLACDNVEAFEIVTADGATVRATASNNADLFWGLRGGGGNFGVVTEFAFRLHPVGRQALVADFYFDFDDAAAVMRRWADLIPEAPRQATLTAWVGPAARVPSLTDGSSGPVMASVGFVWVGDPTDGRSLLPTFRGLGPAIAESVEEMSYLELQSIADDSTRSGMRRYWKGHYFRELSDSAIAAFLSLPASDTDLHAGLQSYGGGIADTGEHESAFSQRDALVEFVAGTRWVDPADDDAQVLAARRYGAAVEPFASGIYVNSLLDEGDQGMTRAYRPDNLRRLTELKGRYDPENVFRLNHNVRPLPDPGREVER